MNAKFTLGLLVIVLILPLSVETANGASRLIFKTFFKEKNSQVNVILSDGFAKIVGALPGNIELIFDEHNNQAYIVNHSDKSVIKLNKKEIAALTQTANNLTNILKLHREKMSKSSQKNLDDLTRRLGLPNLLNKDSRDFTLNSTNARGLAANIKCDWWHMMDKNRISGEICFTKSKSINIEKRDRITLIKLINFSQDILTLLNDILSQIEFYMPPINLPEKNIIPIIYEDIKHNIKTELIAVDNLDINLTITPPSNYKEVNLKNFSNLIF